MRLPRNDGQRTGQARRKFDATFKREAVQNWLNSGKSAEIVGPELGLSASPLYAWRKLLPAGAGGRAPALKPGAVADVQSQLEAAQREPRYVREQCSILKNIGHSLRTVRQCYERIDAMKTEHLILALCLHLGVSPSGSYDWRAVVEKALVPTIVQIHARSLRSLLGIESKITLNTGLLSLAEGMVNCRN